MQELIPLTLPDPNGSIIEPAAPSFKQAVDGAFLALGGVPALANWAYDHPTEFYTRLLPKIHVPQTQTLHSGKVLIEHALKPSALDHPDATPENAR